MQALEKLKMPAKIEKLSDCNNIEYY